MNTENGFRIFGITIKYIRILVLGDHASVGSRDHFSVWAPVISRHWYITRSILGGEILVGGFYKLFRSRLLVYVKLFLDHL